MGWLRRLGLSDWVAIAAVLIAVPGIILAMGSNRIARDARAIAGETLAFGKAQAAGEDLRAAITDAERELETTPDLAVPIDEAWRRYSDGRRLLAAEDWQAAEETFNAGLVRLVDAAEGPLARALLVTAGMTGMRRGELLGLRWRDVDYVNRRVWVRRSIGLGGTVKTPKTRKSIRAIALPRMVADELEALWKASEFRAADDYIFASTTGTPLDGRNMVREVFEPARRRAKLPRVRFHDLRHSYASVLIAQGAHPKVISDQLGHASVQITMDRYSHLFDGAYADVSDELEQAWAAAETDEIRVRP